MGRVADALRANLRQLALSDARSLRELQAELGAGGKGGASATPRVLPGGGAVAGLPAGGGSGDGLDELGVTKLRALCRERGLKGYSRFTKAQCLALLRGGEASAREAGNTGAPHLEQRLDRLEALVVLVAERVGVPVERITAVLKG